MKRAICMLLVVLLLCTAVSCGKKAGQTGEDLSDPREDLMAGTVTEEKQPEPKPEEKPEEKPETQAEEQPSEPEETTPDEEDEGPEETEPVQEEIQETEVMLTNPLSGEPTETDFTRYRPFAIMLDNVAAALPQDGVSRCEILYEATVEGVTRCMAVFQDLSAAEKFGGIRSCRSWFVDLALAYDAFYIHKGASKEGTARINETKVHDVNPYIAGWFYRDEWREATVGYVHSFTANVPNILAEIDQKYDVYHPEGYSYGLTFAQNPVLPETAEDAEKIELCLNTKNTLFEYDAEHRQYLAFQYGKPWVDHAYDNVQISFRNVLALNVRTYYNGVYCKHQLTGTGTGVWFIDGKAIPITWSRETLSDPFSYYLEDGTPVTLGVGHTYIGLIGSTGWIKYTAQTAEAEAE